MNREQRRRAARTHGPAQQKALALTKAWGDRAAVRYMETFGAPAGWRCIDGRFHGDGLLVTASMDHSSDPMPELPAGLVEQMATERGVELAPDRERRAPEVTLMISRDDHALPDLADVNRVVDAFLPADRCGTPTAYVDSERGYAVAKAVVVEN